MNSFLLFLLLPACAAGQAAPDASAFLAAEPVYWHENGTRRLAFLALDEAAVVFFGQEPAADRIARVIPEAEITAANNFVVYLKLPAAASSADAAGVRSTLDDALDSGRTCPVFYTQPEKGRGARLVLTGLILVKYKDGVSESEIQSLEKEYGLTRTKALSFAPNTFQYQAGRPLESLDAANGLHESGRVDFAYPDWLRSRSTRSSKLVPDDPLYGRQWNLSNTGQGGGTAGEDVHIESVWNEYRGNSDLVIAIVDNGLSIAHEDLAPNVVPDLSWDYVDQDSDPTGGSHGTSCAGVAAARGENGLGVSGSAPLAGLAGYRLLDAQTDTNEADALTRHSQVVKIYSNSWGPTDNGQFLEGPGPLTRAAMANAISAGRDGLGVIYVWAGGNGRLSGDNANYDGYANSRYTIAVGASTNLGKYSYYSEPGADILINAPSNGGSMAVTTTAPPGEGNLLDDYTSAFGGTSSACPLAAGIVALMLEANPNLTWRDVQFILADTAEQNDPEHGDWTFNQAGFHINHQYGFGRINALAAVKKAEDFSSLGPEVSASGSQTPDLAINDNDSDGVSSSIEITEEFTVQHVDIYFSAGDHPSWGDLEITLLAPSGTLSILAEQHNGGSAFFYDNWRFSSVRHLGETSRGTWTLTVRDLKENNTGTFEKWSITIYGYNKAEPIDVENGRCPGSGGCFIQATSG